MRIIAGSLKGRRLFAPRWAGLRPTSDRLRETLFDIVGLSVAGASVLDGFAGTGALGIEALSRGAARVTFVERDPRAVSLIARNLRHCGVEAGYAIIRATLEAAVRRIARTAQRARSPEERLFDLILLDPPYDAPGVAAALGAAATLLAHGGLLVLEHARRRPPAVPGDELALVRQVTAGDSGLAFYARK